MGKQFGFFVDQSKCIGCRTCQMACKDYKHLNVATKTKVGQNFRRVYEYEGGTWQEDGDGNYTNDVFAYYTSISCNHCTDPACTKVCPTGAMHKRESDGIVVVNHDKCIGCRSCEMACPYGAPQFNETTGHMDKCNMCVERLEVNKQPICVEACPDRVLEVGEISELRKKYGNVAGVAPLVSSSITGPNLVIKPSPQAKPSGDKEGNLTAPNPQQKVEDAVSPLIITGDK